MDRRTKVRGQIIIEMPLKTTSFSNIQSKWHTAPPRWGHKWHSMCSYMAMFPPTIPHVFVRWLTSPGDTVYDPFCGRGTTVLEACRLGRIGLGSDANPLAWILTSAKANPPSHSAIRLRLSQLRDIQALGDIESQPIVVRSVFDPNVLAQLVWLRSVLSLKSKVDRYLFAVLLGVLHANAGSDGTPRGLTIAMPNTFSMAPRYVMNYKTAHGLVAPKRDVLSFLENRIEQLGKKPSGFCRGNAWLADAIETPAGLSRYDPPRLIFTSPPYLSVIKYGKFNWLRLWLLGMEPSEVDSVLFTSSSLPLYLEFMSKVIRRMEAAVADDGRICLVIGDVKRGDININLAQAVAETCLAGSTLRIDALIEDELPVGQKVSRIWKDRRGHATKTDRIAILSAKRASRLPRLQKLDWSLNN